MDKHHQELENFFMRYTHRRYEKGETLISGGEEPPGIFYVKEGKVRKYTVSAATGSTLTLNVYQPRSYFPLTWALTDTPNRHFYEAVTDTVVYRAPKQEVLTFLQSKPEILYFLSKRLLTSIDSLLTRVEIMAFSDVYTRVVTELLYLIKHYGRPDGKGGITIGHFTHQEIADYLGVARESVSIAMKKLEREGLITHDNHMISIPHPAALEAKMKRV